jgi:hypothetical protein
VNMIVSEAAQKRAVGASLDAPVCVTTFAHESDTCADAMCTNLCAECPATGLTGRQQAGSKLFSRRTVTLCGDAVSGPPSPQHSHHLDQLVSFSELLSTMPQRAAFRTSMKLCKHARLGIGGHARPRARLRQLQAVAVEAQVGPTPEAYVRASERVLEILNVECASMPPHVLSVLPAKALVAPVGCQCFDIGYRATELDALRASQRGYNSLLRICTWWLLLRARL